jgi:phospholipase/carboxylesterase
MFNPSLLGRLQFRLTPGAALTDAPLPPGRNYLGIAAERDAVLYVPASLDVSRPVPLMVMFHGAGGFPEKILPYLENLADTHGFLILAPHSLLPTWDLVIAGNGPDLERLDTALAKVALMYAINPEHLAFAGFSDGGSYALSIGVTNGDVASHVIVFSGGFMSVFMQEGTPKIFIAHGLQDEQVPIESSARKHVAKLEAAGYEVRAVEFNDRHVLLRPIAALAVAFFLGPDAQPA